jgi:hypothetical protein
MTSFCDSILSGYYLSKVNHTFFDAVTELNTLLNGFNNEKENILRRVRMLSHIQDHLYHTDEYSEMGYNDLDEKVDTLMSLEEKKQALDLFSSTFGYESATIDEEVAFQQIILKICIYHKTWTDEPTPIFRSDYTDDFYEWFIYTKKLDNSTLEDRCVGMHDAWALALMYGAQVCEDGTYIFTPKRELGTNPDVTDDLIPIVNSYETIDEINHLLSTIGKKDAIRLEYDDLFNCEKRTLRLESRRLSQLVDYSNLSKEEKIKDLIPAMVCHYVNKI